MSHIYDSTSRNRLHVHWNDETIHPSPKENQFSGTIKHNQRISLNASLPFHSKIHIRIHASRFHRNDSNENNRIKATAIIRPLDSQHYSTLSSDEYRRIHSEILPTHSQISLPFEQRLCLYIHNGEVYKRC